MDRSDRSLDSSPSRELPATQERDPLDELGSGQLAQLRQLAAAPSRYRADDIDLVEGTRLDDHLRIERRLGAGSMGAVFLAFDERLERRVAVKIHLDTEEKSVARLEREARALARVNHPNVLAVHEVGKVGPRLFVATEFVQGRDLRAWSQEERAWTEVVEVFIAAGEGLVAAHRAGLVHRDFKPANVLIGDDGRVRVADFGLARSAGRDDLPEGTLCGVSGVDTKITQTRAAVGTPAYMAPEQFRGEASPLADQFSFCVALAEALWGQRPYGDTLAYTAADEDFELPAAARASPRWLRAVVERGVALDPKRRFESMEAVVARLRSRLRGRGRWATWGAVGVAIAAVGALGGVLASVDDLERCRGTIEPISTVWNESTDARLNEAFVAALPEAGAGAWRVLSQRLDAYAAAWSQERTASCRATHEEGTQSERLLEQSISCFERRREELSGVLRGLERVGSAGVSEAWQAIPEPIDLQPCRDSTRLMRWAEAPPRSASVLADIRYAQTLARIGYAQESLALLEETMNRAEAVDDDHAVVHAQLQIAKALAQVGNAEGAVSKAEGVYFTAKKLGWPSIEAQAAMLLAGWVSQFERDFGGARVWLKLARALDGHVSLLDAETTRAEAMMLEAQGRYDVSVDILEASLERTPTEAEHERLLLLDMLTTSYDAAGRPEDSLRAVDDALALAEVLSGDAGAHVPYLLGNKGLVLGRIGRHAEALAAMRKSLELQETIYGKEYADSMGPRLNLAVAHLAAGDPTSALALLPPVDAATRRRWGDDHPDVALVLETRGAARREAGQLEPALADFEEAIRIARDAYGPDHPTVAGYLNQSASTLAELDRVEAARDAYLASARTWERAGQPEHPNARESRVGVAQMSLVLEQWVDAQAHAQKALLVGEADGVTDPSNLRAKFALARAFWGSGNAREQGLDLARDTERAARSADDGALADAIRAWMDAHRETG